MFCIVHRTKQGKVAVLDKEDYVIDYITESELNNLRQRGFTFTEAPMLEKCATLYGNLIKERTLRGSFDGSTYKLIHETLINLKRYLRGMKVPSNLYSYDCRMTNFENKSSKDYLYTIREDGIFWLEDWRVPNNSTLSIQSWDTLIVQFLSSNTFGVIKEYVLDKYLNVTTEDTVSYICERGGIKDGWIVSVSS